MTEQQLDNVVIESMIMSKYLDLVECKKYQWIKRFKIGKEIKQLIKDIK